MSNEEVFAEFERQRIEGWTLNEVVKIQRFFREYVNARSRRNKEVTNLI